MNSSLIKKRAVNTAPPSIISSTEIKKPNKTFLLPDEAIAEHCLHINKNGEDRNKFCYEEAIRQTRLIKKGKIPTFSCEACQFVAPCNN